MEGPTGTSSLTPRVERGGERGGRECRELDIGNCETSIANRVQKRKKSTHKEGARGGSIFVEADADLGGEETVIKESVKKV